MPIVRRYIATDVLTEARKRVHHIFDLHDKVVVAFSGGKDSLVALHLVREVAEERGELPVHAVFRDEEFIPHEVADFVAEHRGLDWLDLRWLAVPLQSYMFMLGRTIGYVQWDETSGRKWVREKPEWALGLADVGLPPGTVLSQYDADEVTAAPFKGKVAVVNGIRAAESLTRYRVSVNKLNDNYINATSSKRVALCKPLFDWEERDVFRFFFDNDIRYCGYYEAELWAGAPRLRVSSALTAGSAKTFGVHRATCPELYDAIMDVFPEMQVMERYWAEYDIKAATAAEAHSDVEGWIVENIESPFREEALKHLAAAVAMDANEPGAYPPTHCMKAMQSGEGVKRMFREIPRKDRR